MELGPRRQHVVWFLLPIPQWHSNWTPLGLVAFAIFRTAAYTSVVFPALNWLSSQKCSWKPDSCYRNIRCVHIIGGADYSWSLFCTAHATPLKSMPSSSSSWRAAEGFLKDLVQPPEPQQRRLGVFHDQAHSSLPTTKNCSET